MIEIQSPEIRTAMIHDLIDKERAILKERDGMIDAGTFEGEEKEEMNFRFDKILLGILELRGRQPIPEVEVELFEPRESEETHPFQGNIVKIIAPTDDGLRSFYTNLYDLSNAGGINSIQVRQIIGVPDRRPIEYTSRTTQRLVNELGDLKTARKYATNEDLGWMHRQIGLIGEKLVDIWINRQAENLTIGEVKSRRQIVFCSTVESKRRLVNPVSVALNARPAWLQKIEASGLQLDFSEE